MRRKCTFKKYVDLLNIFCHHRRNRLFDMEESNVKLFLFLGSLNMVLGISIGAFGAHGLSGKVTEKMLHNWNTGAQYHLIHALGLLIVGILMTNFDNASTLLGLAGWFMLLGILLFSGSLYALVLSDLRTWGVVTPIGGLFYIVSWVLVAVTVVRNI